MSKKDEALKLALVAERVLKAWDDPQGMPALCEEMNCLREALAEQPAQPSKPWVGLTDEDLAGCDDEELKEARYWERVLREKNA